MALVEQVGDASGFVGAAALAAERVIASAINSAVLPEQAILRRSDPNICEGFVNCR
jgi:hypothetical protein